MVRSKLDLGQQTSKYTTRKTLNTQHYLTGQYTTAYTYAILSYEKGFSYIAKNTQIY